MPIMTDNLNAPTHRVSMDRAKRGRLPKAAANAATISGVGTLNAADLYQPLFVGGDGYPTLGSEHCLTNQQLTHAPLPRPVLPDGALW